MRYLIRFISRNVAGSIEQHDRVIEEDCITIGRATDQVLHLKDRRVRLQHARIERKGAAVHISTNALAGIAVNGRSQRDAELAPGDVIEVGSNVLRVIEPPADVDFAISFELSEAASGEHLVSRWSNPAAGVGGWSKRKLSWTLATLVLLFGFAVPWIGVPNFLLAGPLHSAHSTIGDDCGACHVAVFQRVPDNACMDCHEVRRHVVEPDHAVLGEVRCAACHLDHNEPQQLINQHQALCTDCHQDLPDTIDLSAAGDFLDEHPDFRVSLERPVESPAGDLDWRVEHVDLAVSRDADRSNLKFDHEVHVDSEGLMTPDGKRVIDCAECHVPEPGGARMLPISMDEHCSACHTLAFDPDDPTRTVPHGDPQAVLQALIEYYSARLLGDDPDAVDRRVRRPGQSLTRADRDRAAAEARNKAMEVATDLFERRTCINCHEVTTTDGDLPWRVLPVRLTGRFFPHASFSHAAHDTEVSACDSCHEASSSSAATDLLIPDIDNCRDCHGSGIDRRNSASQLPSTCVMCHGFHFEAKESYP